MSQLQVHTYTYQSYDYGYRYGLGAETLPTHGLGADTLETTSTHTFFCCIVWQAHMQSHVCGTYTLRVVPQSMAEARGTRAFTYLVSHTQCCVLE